MAKQCKTDVAKSSRTAEEALEMGKQNKTDVAKLHQQMEEHVANGCTGSHDSASHKPEEKVLKSNVLELAQPSSKSWHLLEAFYSTIMIL